MLSVRCVGVSLRELDLQYQASVSIGASLNHDSPKRSILEVSPQFPGRFVLPLEGKGDRFAVDEVKMRTGPLSRSV